MDDSDYLAEQAFDEYQHDELKEAYEKQIEALQQELKAKDEQLKQEEIQHGGTIDQRDYWENKATELAEDVGSFLGLEVGEHSSANCPVQNAIDWLALKADSKDSEKEVKYRTVNVKRFHFEMGEDSVLYDLITKLQMNDGNGWRFIECEYTAIEIDEKDYIEHITKEGS